MFIGSNNTNIIFLTAPFFLAEEEKKSDDSDEIQTWGQKKIVKKL